MVNSVYKQRQWNKSKPLSESWCYQCVIGVLSVFGPGDCRSTCKTGDNKYGRWNWVSLNPKALNTASCVKEG